MAQDRPRKPGQPAWKAAGGPQKAAPGGPKYAWKPHEEVTQSHWARRAKLAGLIFGGLGCVAVIIVLIYWLRPQRGASLILVGADPSGDVENLAAPLDAYGWRGGKRLAEWSAEAFKSERTRSERLTPQLADENQLNPESIRPNDLEAFLQKLGGQRRDTLIVYFGLHGGADQTGPFLFTAGGGRLYLRELIDGFAGPRLKDKKVVLLIDSARLAPDPALGVLFPDCVRGLKALDAAGEFDKVPNLVVICGTDDGERGWSAEEWGTTGFAEMVLHGLSGGAANGDLITAYDLFKYVGTQTQSWSQATRPTAQTPILLPEKGGQERAKNITMTAKVGGHEEDWPDAAQLPPPKSLIDHWTQCKILEDGIPSPAVYTPRLWRRYRELLLRYEYLIRAGESETAEKLSESLTRAERELSDGRALRLADGLPKSRGNSLPLPIALGLNVPAQDADTPAGDDAAFTKILREQEREQDKLWDALAKAPGAVPDQLRAKFYEFLLRQAIDPAASQSDIDKAARLMDRPRFKDAGVPLPAEAHLLVMTRAFFSDQRPQAMPGNGGDPPLDLWKRALDVRRLAEGAALGVNIADPVGRAHPYSEQLWKYLEPAVVAGDSRRRDGEDLLFSAAGYDRAGKEFDTAAKAYKDDVLVRAKAMQAAYAARDNALADLPLLTRWIAALPAKSDAGQAEQLKELWLTKVHPLARQLNGSPAGAEALTEEVRRGVDKFRQAYADKCRDLRAKILQTQWRELEQVLSIPLVTIDAGLRQALMEASRKQVAKLSGEWALSGARVAVPTPAAAEDVKADRRLQAIRWGDLAAAVLGEIATDQKSGPKGNLLDAPGLHNDLVKMPADNWQPQLALDGDQIGRHWQLLADADGSANEVQAEFRSRWSIAFRPPASPEPATVNRQKRWQSLFVGLAQRTATDHWYEMEGQPVEYFRAAADRYLADAKQAVGDGTAAVPGAAPVKDLLATEKLRLEPVGFDQRVYWTSETHRTLTFKVDSKGGPGGYVTLWPEIAKAPALTLSPDDVPRQPVQVEGARRDLHVEAKRTATNDSVKLAAHGYFRGQWLKAGTEIILNRTPELILARTTPLNDAAIAARGDDDLSLGAIAIVLDFSGSMKATPDGKDNLENPASKYRQAVAKLREVLLGLPPDTPISLRLFGHDDARFFDNQEYAREKQRLSATLPADEADEVAGSMATKSELIYQGAVTWSRSNPGPLEKAILSKLEAKKPNYYTPLLRTMAEAKADFPPNYQETKTLLVLTDGSDNFYPKSNRQTRVKKELKDGFNDAGIAVQVVLFRVDKKELNDALEQFGDLPKFKTPGRVTVADKNDKLEESIDLALRPTLRLVDTSGEPAKGLALSGLPINRANDPLTALRGTPAIDPKLYDGYVLESRQRINLRRGDRMLVRLKRDSVGVKFSRDLLADDPRLTGRVARAEDWVLGLPRYHAQTTSLDKQLWLTATLESPLGRSPSKGGVLQQVHPGFVWWEVVPASGNHPTTLRVEERSQLPAPAWTMVVEGWPHASTIYKPATIRAWVDLNPAPAAHRVKINSAALAAGEVVVDVPGETGEDGKPGKLQLFASLEPWPLRLDPSPKEDFKTDPPEPVPCLVIRILHPDKNKPLFVRPDQVEFGAYQQLFYPSSAAITAVFGPVTKDDLEVKLHGRPLELDLISVDRFKADHPTPLTLNMTGPAGPEQSLVNPLNLGEKADKAP